jgi:hypothetical protein
MEKLMKTESLDSPSVPAAEQDGLVPTSELENDLMITFDVPDFVKTGDSYQLLLNNRELGPSQPFPIPDPETRVKLTVHISKNEFFSDGMYEIAYRYITYPGGNIADSKPALIQVDRTKPGATLLAPLIFPTATLGDQLVGLLPGYAGMEPGDIIQTLLNGVAGPAHQVQADELTLRPIEIPFSREHLQAHAAETVSIEYVVTDRAGNVSITSLPTLVSVKL